MNFSSKKILSLLHIRQDIAGLEVSDSALRFVSFKEGVWMATTLRLPPGILVNGVIQDKPQFAEALRTLRENTVRLIGKHRQVSVTVCLSSINVYTQVFSLPMIEGEGFEKAVELNLQMVSPTDLKETNTGWQVVGEDKKTLKYDVLSSFVNRAAVKDMVDTINASGFWVYALEPRAVALGRLLRTLVQGFEKEKPAIMFSVTDGGIEILVIRNGQPYFSYGESWKDIQGDNREIPLELFQAAVIRNLNQVLNFYSTHWPAEPVEDLYFFSTALSAELAAAVKNNFTLNVREVTLDLKYQFNPDLYVGAGSALRAQTPPKRDRDISLLGISVREDYIEHQWLHFLSFWEVLTPAVLAILVVVFFSTDIFLRQIIQNLKSGNSETALQSQQISELRQQANDFNQSVGYLQTIANSGAPKYVIMREFDPLLQSNGVTVQQFQVSKDMNAKLFATAPGETEIVSFKQALEKNPMFSKVDLPLSGIAPAAPQGKSFTMTFSVNAVRTP